MTIERQQAGRMASILDPAAWETVRTILAIQIRDASKGDRATYLEQVARAEWITRSLYERGFSTWSRGPADMMARHSRKPRR